MKFVLDTNVLMSGFFFGGKPGQIMDWWLTSDSDLIVTEEVLAEYESVLERLSRRYPSVLARQLFQQIVLRCVVVEPSIVSSHDCVDPTDIKFLACAAGGSCDLIVSGDKHLLDVNGWQNVRIINPSTFVAEITECP